MMKQKHLFNPNAKDKLIFLLSAKITQTKLFVLNDPVGTHD